MKLADLKPAPFNPRQIADAAAIGLAESLDRFGDISGIVWNKSNGFLVTGHQRLKALQAKFNGGVTMAGGKVKTPAGSFAVRVVEWDDDKHVAAMISANNQAISGEWDQPLLKDALETLDDYPTETLLMDDLLDASVEDQAVEEVDVEDGLPARTKAGDVWTLGRHRLMCGDCTDKGQVEALMRGERADCVFTSPPYAVGIEYGTYKDTIENLRAMLPQLAAMWLNVVKPGAYAVVNFGDIVSAREIVGTDEPCEYPMALEYWPVFRSEGWVLWSRRAWCKPCAGTGSMQCISSNRAATNWENVWTWKSPGKPLHRQQTTGEYASQNGWIDSTHTHKLGVRLKEHGAGMPVFVAAYGVAVHSFKNAIVHEPFCGTGTTIIAAEQLDRICYAMEIEPKYCDVALARWEKLTGEVAVLDGK